MGGACTTASKSSDPSLKPPTAAGGGGGALGQSVSNVGGGASSSSPAQGSGLRGIRNMKGGARSPTAMTGNGKAAGADRSAAASELRYPGAGGPLGESVPSTPNPVTASARLELGYPSVADDADGAVGGGGTQLFPMSLIGGGASGSASRVRPFGAGNSRNAPSRGRHHRGDDSDSDDDDLHTSNRNRSAASLSLGMGGSNRSGVVVGAGSSATNMRRRPHAKPLLGASGTDVPLPMPSTSGAAAVSGNKPLMGATGHHRYMPSLQQESITDSEASASLYPPDGTTSESSMTRIAPPTLQSRHMRRTRQNNNNGAELPSAVPDDGLYNASDADRSGGGGVAANVSLGAVGIGSGADGDDGRGGRQRGEGKQRTRRQRVVPVGGVSALEGVAGEVATNTGTSQLSSSSYTDSSTVSTSYSTSSSSDGGGGGRGRPRRRRSDRQQSRATNGPSTSAGALGRGGGGGGGFGGNEGGGRRGRNSNAKGGGGGALSITSNEEQLSGSSVVANHNNNITNTHQPNNSAMMNTTKASVAAIGKGAVVDGAGQPLVSTARPNRVDGGNGGSSVQPMSAAALSDASPILLGVVGSGGEGSGGPLSTVAVGTTPHNNTLPCAEQSTSPTTLANMAGAADFAAHHHHSGSAAAPQQALIRRHTAATAALQEAMDALAQDPRPNKATATGTVGATDAPTAVIPSPQLRASAGGPLSTSVSVGAGGGPLTLGGGATSSSGTTPTTTTTTTAPSESKDASSTTTAEQHQQQHVVAAELPVIGIQLPALQTASPPPPLTTAGAHPLSTTTTPSMSHPLLNVSAVSTSQHQHHQQQAPSSSPHHLVVTPEERARQKQLALLRSQVTASKELMKQQQHYARVLAHVRSEKRSALEAYYNRSMAQLREALSNPATTFFCGPLNRPLLHPNENVPTPFEDPSVYLLVPPQDAVSRKMESRLEELLHSWVCGVASTEQGTHNQHPSTGIPEEFTTTFYYEKIMKGAIGEAVTTAAKEHAAAMAKEAAADGGDNRSPVSAPQSQPQPAANTMAISRTNPLLNVVATIPPPPIALAPFDISSSATSYAITLPLCDNSYYAPNKLWNGGSMHQQQQGGVGFKGGEASPSSSTSPAGAMKRTASTATGKDIPQTIANTNITDSTCHKYYDGKKNNNATPWSLAGAEREDIEQWESMVMGCDAEFYSTAQMVNSPLYWHAQQQQLLREGGGGGGFCDGFLSDPHTAFALLLGDDPLANTVCSGSGSTTLSGTVSGADGLVVSPTTNTVAPFVVDPSRLHYHCAVEVDAAPFANGGTSSRGLSLSIGGGAVGQEKGSAAAGQQGNLHNAFASSNSDPLNNRSGGSSFVGGGGGNGANPSPNSGATTAAAVGGGGGFSSQHQQHRPSLGTALGVPLEVSVNVTSPSELFNNPLPTYPTANRKTTMGPKQISAARNNNNNNALLLGGGAGRTSSVSPTGRGGPSPCASLRPIVAAAATEHVFSTAMSAVMAHQHQHQHPSGSNYAAAAADTVPPPAATPLAAAPLQQAVGHGGGGGGSHMDDIAALVMDGDNTNTNTNENGGKQQYGAQSPLGAHHPSGQPYGGGGSPAGSRDASQRQSMLGTAANANGTGSSSGGVIQQNPIIASAIHRTFQYTHPCASAKHTTAALMLYTSYYTLPEPVRKWLTVAANDIPQQQQGASSNANNNGSKSPTSPQRAGLMRSPHVVHHGSPSVVLGGGRVGFGPPHAPDDSTTDYAVGSGVLGGGFVPIGGSRAHSPQHGPQPSGGAGAQQQGFGWASFTGDGSTSAPLNGVAGANKASQRRGPRVSAVTMLTAGTEEGGGGGGEGGQAGGEASSSSNSAAVLAVGGGGAPRSGSAHGLVTSHSGSVANMSIHNSINNPHYHANNGHEASVLLPNNNNDSSSAASPHHATTNQMLSSVSSFHHNGNHSAVRSSGGGLNTSGANNTAGEDASFNDGLRSVASSQFGNNGMQYQFHRGGVLPSVRAAAVAPPPMLANSSIASNANTIDVDGAHNPYGGGGGFGGGASSPNRIRSLRKSTATSFGSFAFHSPLASVSHAGGASSFIHHNNNNLNSSTHSFVVNGGGGGVGGPIPMAPYNPVAGVGGGGAQHYGNHGYYAAHNQQHNQYHNHTAVHSVFGSTARIVVLDSDVPAAVADVVPPSSAASASPLAPPPPPRLASGAASPLSRAPSSSSPSHASTMSSLGGAFYAVSSSSKRPRVSVTGGGGTSTSVGAGGGGSQGLTTATGTTASNSAAVTVPTPANSTALPASLAGGGGGRASIIPPLGGGGGRLSSSSPGRMASTIRRKVAEAHGFSDLSGAGPIHSNDVVVMSPRHGSPSGGRVVVAARSGPSARSDARRARYGSHTKMGRSSVNPFRDLSAFPVDHNRLIAKLAASSGVNMKGHPLLDGASSSAAAAALLRSANTPSATPFGHGTRISVTAHHHHNGIGSPSPTKSPIGPHTNQHTVVNHPHLHSVLERGFAAPPSPSALLQQLGPMPPPPPQPATAKSILPMLFPWRHLPYAAPSTFTIMLMSAGLSAENAATYSRTKRALRQSVPLMLQLAREKEAMAAAAAALYPNTQSCAAAALDPAELSALASPSAGGHANTNNGGEYRRVSGETDASISINTPSLGRNGSLPMIHMDATIAPRGNNNNGNGLLADMPSQSSSIATASASAGGGGGADTARSNRVVVDAASPSGAAAAGPLGSGGNHLALPRTGSVHHLNTLAAMQPNSRRSSDSSGGYALGSSRANSILAGGGSSQQGSQQQQHGHGAGVGGMGPNRSPYPQAPPDVLLLPAPVPAFLMRKLLPAVNRRVRRGGGGGGGGNASRTPSSNGVDGNNAAVDSFNALALRSDGTANGAPISPANSTSLNTTNGGADASSSQKKQRKDGSGSTAKKDDALLPLWTRATRKVCLHDPFSVIVETTKRPYGNTNATSKGKRRRGGQGRTAHANSSANPSPTAPLSGSGLGKPPNSPTKKGAPPLTMSQPAGAVVCGAAEDGDADGYASESLWDSSSASSDAEEGSDATNNPKEGGGSANSNAAVDAPIALRNTATAFADDEGVDSQRLPMSLVGPLLLDLHSGKYVPQREAVKIVCRWASDAAAMGRHHHNSLATTGLSLSSPQLLFGGGNGGGNNTNSSSTATDQTVGNSVISPVLRHANNNGAANPSASTVTTANSLFGSSGGESTLYQLGIFQQQQQREAAAAERHLASYQHSYFSAVGTTSMSLVHPLPFGASTNSSSLAFAGGRPLMQQHQSLFAGAAPSSYGLVNNNYSLHQGHGQHSNLAAGQQSHLQVEGIPHNTSSQMLGSDAASQYQGRNSSSIGIGGVLLGQHHAVSLLANPVLAAREAAMSAAASTAGSSSNTSSGGGMGGAVPPPVGLPSASAASPAR